MRLRDAMRILPTQALAFTGAGGKSTAIARLVNELRGDFPVLLTTSTKFSLAQTDLAQKHLVHFNAEDLKSFGQTLQSHASVLVTGPRLPDEPKWSSPGHQALARMHETVKGLGGVMLVEADGARGRSLKAPATHEPVVPTWIDQVLVVAGLDAIGTRLNSELIFRPEQMQRILGVEKTAQITAERMAELLTSTQAGLKGLPPRAAVRVLLNKAEDAKSLDAGRQVAKRLMRVEKIRSVLLGAVGSQRPVRECHSRVAGVILAAGKSVRLDTAKQHIRWRGKTLLEHAVSTASEGGLAPIALVVGPENEKLAKAHEGESVQVHVNPSPEEGQSSSLRLGIEAIRSKAEVVVILLSDMPLIEADLIKALVARHRTTLKAVIVPYAQGRRGNPVLFDGITFEALLRVKGDQGGRAIFDRFPPSQLAWDDSVLFDVDTPEDLRRLRDME